MCGRYRLEHPEEAAEFIRVKLSADRINSRWNVAPRQQMPVVVVDEGQRVAKAMRWGLVPFYARQQAKPMPLINARFETAMSKAAFKKSIQRRRCAVLADGFYEWKKLDERTKQPFFFSLKDEKPFAFAGIYEDASDGQPGGYCLFTTRPNAVLEGIHDRMPVTLDNAGVEAWLADGEMSEERFNTLATPYPSERMQSWPVTQAMNSTRFENAEASRPVEVVPRPILKADLDTDQLDLF